MDQFPQELIDQICVHLPSEDLRNIYDVSTKLRKAAEDIVERHEGHWREITKENKQQFIDRYSSFRLRFLEKVTFYTHFPDLELDGDENCRESADEQRERDRLFTEQIQDLFATLKTVEERAGERNRGKYELKIYGPSQGRSGNHWEYCHHRDYHQWRTHLLEPQTLPNLMSVRSLEIDNGHSPASAKLDYRILIDLMIRLPNLENLECHTGQGEWNPWHGAEPADLFVWEYDGPRRDSRHDFGKAITPSNIPKSLQRVELDFLCRIAMFQAEDGHHWKAMPNLVSPVLKDPFSTGLRILSYHLRELTLRAQVDETLFWPEDGSTPIWPHLQRIFIMFHMVSPSGAWYFEGPRGEGRGSIGYELNESSYPPLETTEDDLDLDWEVDDQGDRSFDTGCAFHFRISPDDSVLGPFLESFAKAAANMPDLRQAILWSPLRWDIGGDEDEAREAFEYFELSDELPKYGNRLAWGMAYYFTGLGSLFAEIPREANREARQIWWKVGKWRPTPELHNLFQQIGRQKHSPALEEHWGKGRQGRFYFWTPDE